MNLEMLTAAIGPTGDVVYVPFRIREGKMTSRTGDSDVICGMDIAAMFADEKLIHNGNVVIADSAGDVLLWYDGSSKAAEGAYDLVLEGRLPQRIPSRFSVRLLSTNPEWVSFNRRPLLGVGWFDGDAGSLDFTLLSVKD